MSVLTFFYHGIVLAMLLWSLAMVLANLACFDGLRAAEPCGPDAPLVSILVPARNEALNIAACARSLLAQDYPNWELIVLDDHSEDATAEIVCGLGVRELGGRTRLLRGEALPRGGAEKLGLAINFRGRLVASFCFSRTRIRSTRRGRSAPPWPTRGGRAPASSRRGRGSSPSRGARGSSSR